MPDHTVGAGECITSIADQYGFFWRTIWNHEKNARLRARRADPNTLVPGDVVHVPDPRPKAEPRSTGAAHRFRLKGIPALFRVQLFHDTVPRAGEPFRLTVDGVGHEGVTSEDGVLEVAMPANARQATLIIGPDDEAHEFELGRLPPINEVEGVQARLSQLGFDCDTSGEVDEKTTAAIRLFQARVGLEPTGAPDAQTCSELQKLHNEVNRLPDPREHVWADLGEPA